MCLGLMASNSKEHAKRRSDVLKTSTAKDVMLWIEEIPNRTIKARARLFAKWSLAMQG